MNNNASLRKISDNEFVISGDCDYYETQYKEVIIDGLKYTNKTCIDRNINFDESFERFQKDPSEEDSWKPELLDFTEFGIPIIKVWYNTNFSTPETMLRYHIWASSSNSYARYITSLFDLKILNRDIITDLYTGSHNIANSSIDRCVFEDHKVPFIYDEYAPGWYIYLNVKLEMFYQINCSMFEDHNQRQFKRYNKIYPKLFPLKMLERKLDEDELLEISLALIEYSINFKQQK